MQNSKKTFSPRENTVRPLPDFICRLISHLPSGIHVAIYIILSIFITSCGTTKNPVYFENLKKDTTLHNIVTPQFDLKIQKEDMLSIMVASLSPDVTFYNAPQNTVGPLNGYLVDKNGNISFLKLGTIHVEGMTRKQLKDSLQKSLEPYLKDNIVSVGFLNRHITMLGGIAPTILPIANDNMTILDALAASGDIGSKGKIDNVLVIRDSANAKVFKRLNLKNNSVFYSPYYYMQPNDIVYVEPVKNTANKLTAPQIIAYITSGISLIFLILNTLKL